MKHDQLVISLALLPMQDLLGTALMRRRNVKVSGLIAKCQLLNDINNCELIFATEN